MNYETRELRQQAQLEEYRALRDEITLRTNERNQTYLTAAVMTGALLGYGMGAEVPPVFLAPVIILVVLWGRHLRWLRMIFSLGAYIQVYLEEEVEGLQWETSATGPVQSRRSGLDWDALRSTFTCPYLPLVGASLVLSGYYWAITENWQRSFSTWLVVVLPVGVLVIAWLLWATYKLEANGKQHFVHHWQQQKDAGKHSPCGSTT